MQSVNAWLQHQIDEYKFLIRDVTVDFYMAEARLNRQESHIDHLRRYHNACMEMIDLCRKNGDDESYLHALVKLHNRLIKEINNEGRYHLFRVQSYYFARNTLKLICLSSALKAVGIRPQLFRPILYGACLFYLEGRDRQNARLTTHILRLVPD